MTTSHIPPMLAISVGLTRYSREVIQQAGEFVISFPSGAMAEQTLFFGSYSGRDTDKFAECRVNLQPAAKIDSVILTDAVANFECRLVSEHQTGDHMIFVGKVLASYMNKDENLKRLYALASGHVLGGLEQLNMGK
jgi:flavin reductase (DIM6/NTAB) family NADH-FMN oxidoreductase RutF